jgi:hypothetical protein
MKKYSWFLYLMGFLLLVTISVPVTVSALWPERDLGKECYDRIQVGMTEGEVHEIMGELAPHARQLGVGTYTGGRDRDRQWFWLVDEEFAIRIYTGSGIRVERKTLHYVREKEHPLRRFWRLLTGR